VIPAEVEAGPETVEPALQGTGWNRERAAQLPMLRYKTLFEKTRERGLEADC
jgi:hypothetical protein